jgi:hypothetical protein
MIEAFWGWIRNLAAQKVTLEKTALRLEHSDAQDNQSREYDQNNQECQSQENCFHIKIILCILEI